MNKADPEHILVRVDPQYFRPTEVRTCLPCLPAVSVQYCTHPRRVKSVHGHNESSQAKPLTPCTASFPLLTQVDLLLGDPAKAKKVLGWEVEVPFDVRTDCADLPLLTEEDAYIDPALPCPHHLLTRPCAPPT